MEITNESENGTTSDNSYNLVCNKKDNGCFKYKKSDRCRRLRASGIYCQYRDAHKLMQAVLLNNLEAVENKLKIGVDVNCTDEIKRTPLHIATSRGYIDIVNKLIEYGADVNARDGVKNTPLHLAVCTQNVDVIEALINAGAVADLKDYRGCTAIQIAQSRLRLLSKSLSLRGVMERERILKEVNEIVEILIKSLSKENSEQFKQIKNQNSRLEQPIDITQNYILQLLNQLDNLYI